MKIYSSTETNFTRNGYGFLNDCLTAKVTEVLNGENTLYLEYPVNSKLSEYLVEQNIIKTNVGNDDYQLFRIYRVDKDFERIYVYANHITYDLNLNMLVDVYPKNKICNDFGEWLLDNTQFATSFSFYSDISSTASARYVRKNPIDAILGSDSNSMINLFGGELKRDNYTLKLLASRGNNNHVKLMIGKNITEIKTNIDITDLYTRIMPVGFDGLQLPEKFVDSPLINSYPTPRIAKIEFSNIKYDPESTEEGVYTDIQDAYQALRDAVQVLFDDGIDKPLISIKVDWLELSKTEQYKNQFASFERVNLADTITANILGIDYTTKVVKTVYNVLTDTIESFEIGTMQKNIVNSINFTQREIEQINPSSILQDARDSATGLINNALSGNIYLDYQTGNLYIMDNPDPQQARKVWRWNLNGLGYSSTGINGTYGIAMTMDGSIVADYITTGQLNTNVIQGYGALVLQVDKNKSDIATIKAEISDIADITTSSTSDTLFIDSTELENIAVSNPIRVEIHPIITNIMALYPRNDLYPSNSLYPRGRILRFTNTSTNAVFDYELPMDLLYYDENNYDSFVADYETNLVTINKRCGLDNNGNVIVLDDPVDYTYSYSETFSPYTELTEGNYQVEMLGYSTGYLMVRLMVLNAYTAQYATKIEMNSAITQTAQEITLEVSQEIDTLEDIVDGKVNKNQIISSINISPEQIQINSDKISLAGKTIDMTSDNIAIDSTNFKVDKDGNMTCNSGTFGGTITTSDNCIVGNDLKIGVNQATSVSDDKYVKFTNDTYIRRNSTDGYEMLTIQSPAVQLLARNGGLTSSGHITTIDDEAGDFIELSYGTIECNTPITVRSDKRYKTDIKDIDVKWIDDLKVKEYVYKKNPNNKHIGLIAQDYVNKDYSEYFLNQNKDGIYSIEYSSITNALIKYTQELNKRVEQLEKEVKELKGGK